MGDSRLLLAVTIGMYVAMTLAAAGCAIILIVAGAKVFAEEGWFRLSDGDGGDALAVHSVAEELGQSGPA